MEICIDFDGTCVLHTYPTIDPTNIGSEDVLRKLVDRGHKLILFTMRSNRLEGNYLTDAVNWFKDRSIPLYGIQSNPTQSDWTSSPKAYGQLYIDDAALGCPLIYPSDGSRPYVDWASVEVILEHKNIL